MQFKTFEELYQYIGVNIPDYFRVTSEEDAISIVDSLAASGLLATFGLPEKRVNYLIGY